MGWNILDRSRLVGNRSPHQWWRKWSANHVLIKYQVCVSLHNDGKQIIITLLFFCVRPVHPTYPIAYSLVSHCTPLNILCSPLRSGERFLILCKRGGTQLFTREETRKANMCEPHYSTKSNQEQAKWQNWKFFCHMTEIVRDSHTWRHNNFKPAKGIEPILSASKEISEEENYWHSEKPRQKHLTNDGDFFLYMHL